MALGIASIFTDQNIYQQESSWRIAFFVGAGIAFVGTIARTSLKEADEFSNKKNKLQSRLKENNIKIEEINNEFLDQKVPKAVSIWYFCIQCARPPCFYFIYILWRYLKKRMWIYCHCQIKRDH